VLWEPLHSPKALSPPLVQSVDEGLSTGVEDFRPRAEIAEKGDQPRIIAAAVVSENFEHLTGIRQAPALCRTQKDACDPIGEITPDNQQMIIFELIEQAFRTPALRLQCIKKFEQILVGDRIARRSR
jgi:hypothetical protein